MFSPSLTPGIVNKPNRFETPESQKDKKYHAQYGIYTMGAINHPARRIFQVKTLVNWNFYQNNQWIFEEDLESFLKDESGDVRNRIRLVYNMVQPMVQQYIGNAIRMDYNARAVSVSEFVVNRREKELDRLQYFTNLANNMPEIAPAIKASLPIGKNAQDTETIFNNVYVDKFEKNINNLMRFVSEKNNFEQAKMEIARHVALSGLGVHKGYEWGGEQVWDVVDPLYFFYDYSAKKKDLKDAEYMGEVKYVSPVDIAERFQNITPDERNRLEKYASDSPTANRFLFHYMYGETAGKIPVFESYWKDIEVQEWGYVIDEYGYEYLTRINYEGGEYTTKDLITPESENHIKFLGKGKKKRKLYVDVLRYVIFSPSSIIGGGEDIVYEYGLVPYQETSSLSPSNVEYPYKCCAWDLHNGLVLSPVDAVIDPQRIANRMLSIAESRVNNPMGNSVIDKSAVDPQGGEEEVLRNITQNKPVFVDSRGRGVQNVVGEYGRSSNNDPAFIYEIAERMRGIMQNISGVNESMTGTTGSKQKLVGAMKSEIAQGTLLQENFYYTVSEVLLQTYQGIASQGKRIYADSKRRLSIIMGDEGAEEIIITKDMNLEDFRVFIKRVMPDEAQKQAANELLLQLRANGMIEEQEFAKYYGRAVMEDVSEAVRETFKRRQIANMKALEAQAQQDELLGAQAAAQEEQANARERKLIAANEMQRNKDEAADLDKIQARTMGKIATDTNKQQLKNQSEAEI